MNPVLQALLPDVAQDLSCIGQDESCIGQDESCATSPLPGEG